MKSDIKIINTFNLSSYHSSLPGCRQADFHRAKTGMALLRLGCGAVTLSGTLDTRWKGSHQSPVHGQPCFTVSSERDPVYSYLLL